MHFALILQDNPDLRADLDERYRYIMVDEYQDTNLAQYIIVRALSRDHPNLSVTGDPDQSIYGWRGATIRNILEFERDYPQVHVVRLEENFRSTQAILRAADQLISNNVKRKVKTLRTANAEGRPVRLVTYTSGHQEARRHRGSDRQRSGGGPTAQPRLCHLLPHQRAVTVAGADVCAVWACRIRSSADWSSTSGRKSRTSWPTCSC